MKDYLWRQEYPSVTDQDLARWTAQVDRATRTADDLQALLERIKERLLDG